MSMEENAMLEPVVETLAVPVADPREPVAVAVIEARRFETVPDAPAADAGEKAAVAPPPPAAAPTKLSAAEHARRRKKSEKGASARANPKKRPRPSRSVPKLGAVETLHRAARSQPAPKLVRRQRQAKPA